MSTDKWYSEDSPVGFAKYILDAKFGPAKEPSGRRQVLSAHLEELQKATKGVLGMMHFADHRSPILLETLGDLLISSQVENNASQLAARAYLNAALNTDDQSVVDKFRQMATECMTDHIDFRDDEKALVPLQANFAEEVKTAETWFAAIEAKEKSWIAENRDVDHEFAAVYYTSLENTIATAEVAVKSEPRHVRLSQRQKHNRLAVAAGLTCIGIPVALACIAIFGITWVVRRRRPTTPAA